MSSRNQEYINYRVSKSQEIFNDALLLAENQRWNSTVNRLYYSSFYLATALLFRKGIEAETHNGVKTQFFLNFVKTGQVSKAAGKLYANLFDWRQESDYADFSEFDEATVVPLLQQVKEFNDTLKALIIA